MSIGFVQPCPPHEWSHEPTVGAYRCWKCHTAIYSHLDRKGYLHIEAERKAAANTLPHLTAQAESLAGALEECAQVLFDRCPRIPPDGPNTLEEQREYEEIGGAYHRARAALSTYRGEG